MVTEEHIDLGHLLRGQLDEDTHADFVSAAGLILDCRCTLGEGIIYDDSTQTVLWTDIYGRKLHTLKLETPKQVLHRTYDLPKQLCSFGMIEGAEPLTLLCAWDDGFQIYDVANSTPKTAMSNGEDVSPKKAPARLNDGRTDRTGKRFVCGGYFGGVQGNLMKVFKVEQNADGSLVHEAVASDLEVANSICWSLDGKTMYLADSPKKQIHAYDYEDGSLSKMRLLHTKPSNQRSIPDGSCVDSEGYIWNAVWRGGEAESFVQRIDPESGQVVFTVHMPDNTSQVTCCCFGGANLDIMFITTAAEGRDDEPHAGGLYAAKLPFRGLPECRLKFKVP